MDALTPYGILFFIVFLLGIGLTIPYRPSPPRTYFVVTAVPKVDEDVTTGSGCGIVLLLVLLLGAVLGVALLLPPH